MGLGMRKTQISSLYWSTSLVASLLNDCLKVDGKVDGVINPLIIL